MSTKRHFKSKEDFHAFALKNWIAAIKSRDFERAIAFDQLHYETLVKKFEDINFWDRWQQDTRKLRKELTKQFRNIEPDDPILMERGGNIGIILPNYSGLAHEMQLSRNLNYLKVLHKDLKVEIVYLFGEQQFVNNLYGCKDDNIYYLNATSYMDASKRLRLLCQQRKFHTILYPSIFFTAFWMSIFLPHSNQKFLQMKYYPRHSGRIVDWAGGPRVEGKYFSYFGDKYRQLPILSLCNQTDITGPDLSLCREREVFIGSISRPEKVSSERYNRLIKSVLDNANNIRYIYTGRHAQVESIPSFIRNHPRSVPVGWVNPKNVIHKFDIYVDPFPWGGGDMTLLALCNNRPYLIFESKENIEMGVAKSVRIISEGQDAILGYSFCKSEDELYDRIIELSNDELMRNRLGTAWREACLAYAPKGSDDWMDFLMSEITP